MPSSPPRLLVSWISTLSDFDRLDKRFADANKDLSTVNKSIRLDGANAKVQKAFLAKKYDKHLWLLSWNKGADAEAKVYDEKLRYYLEDDRHSESFRNKVELRHVPLLDLIDADEIFRKVYPIIKEYSQYAIDIFITPGNAQMKVAWYLIAYRLESILDLQLKKTRRDNQRKKGEELLTPVILPRDFSLDAISRQEEEKRDRYSPVSQKVVDSPIASPSQVEVYKFAEKVAVAKNQVTLLLGETGTGKSTLARFMHEQSLRKKQPFREVNCSAFTEELLRSELFGHKKGAFTDAKADKVGFFEECDGGTLFLDEIGDTSAYVQQALLDVLQPDKNGISRIKRVGSTKEIKVDVRIIAATNRDLVQLCHQDKFRWDLFYRLAMVDIDLPALREMKDEDRRFWLDHFIHEKAKKYDNRPPLTIKSKTRTQLLAYPFPGNIRELEYLVERFYVVCETEITPAHFPRRIFHPEDLMGPNDHPMNYLWNVKEIEKIILKRALQTFKTDESIANATGISRTNIPNKLKKYNLNKELER